MTALEHWATEFKVHDVEPSRRIISGHAAAAENIDRVRDIVDSGANTKVATRQNPADVAVFIGHKQDSLPVGIPLSIKADADGLFTESYIFPGPQGDQLLETAKALQRFGRSLGMSIGYRVKDAKFERGVDGKTVRRILDYELIEYSFAASQSIANPKALVTGVKAMKYTIEQRGGEFVLLDADGEVEGTYPTRAAAEAEMRRLMRDGDEPETPANRGKTLDGETAAKTTWDAAYVNSLPDSAFLFIEAGGEQEDGKTTPRSKRHFPVRDASGALDAAHLRNAIARIPQSTAPGLDVAALQGRARRMLANLDGGHKTVDTDTPEWQRGAVPVVYGVAAELADLSERIASGQASQRDLDLDTRHGQTMRPAEVAQVKGCIARLQVAVDMADLEAKGAYDQGRSARWRHELDLLELAV